MPGMYLRRTSSAIHLHHVNLCLALFEGRDRPDSQKTGHTLRQSFGIGPDRAMAPPHFHHCETRLPKDSGSSTVRSASPRRLIQVLGTAHTHQSRPGSLPPAAIDRGPREWASSRLGLLTASDRALPTPDLSRS